MQTVNFNEVMQQDLMDWFDIQKVEELPVLTNWLSADNELNTSEKEYLTIIKKDTLKFANGWNEQELFGGMIGPILSVGQLNTDRFHLFAQRELTADIGEIRLTGKVDGLLATGFQRPKKPFFCLNEYKKSFEFRGEPIGQCLAAMLVSHTINNDNNPIYGIFIVGKAWYFLVLENNKYAISPEYDATKNDIFEIPKILKKLKTIVNAILDAEQK